MALKLAIKDEASAGRWRDQVMLVNDEYMEAMREAGETLQQAKDFGEGTIVDEFFELGTNLMSSANKVFEAVNEVLPIVNDVLGKLSILEQGVNGAINIVKNLFG